MRRDAQSVRRLGCETVGAHLVSFLVDGTLRMMWLGLRRGNPDRAIDELARLGAERPATEIAASLREFADRRYWRPPPQAPGLLAEVLAHSGDIRIALGLPFEPDPQPTATALDFLTGPMPLAWCRWEDCEGFVCKPLTLIKPGVKGGKSVGGQPTC